jgi:hypothetical protein
MSLSNFDIEKIVKPVLKKSFLGVFSKDNVPNIGNGQCLVCNIQDSVTGNGQPLPGTHWVACGKSGSQSWYFDSFGLAPLQSLKNKLSNPVLYSIRQVQDPKSVKCGYFAILSCIVMTRSETPEKSMTSMISDFNQPLLIKNDAILTSKLKKYIN